MIKEKNISASIIKLSHNREETKGLIQIFPGSGFTGKLDAYIKVGERASIISRERRDDQIITSMVTKIYQPSEDKQGNKTVEFDTYNSTYLLVYAIIN